MDLVTSMKTPLEQLSRSTSLRTNPKRLLAPSSLVELTFKSAPLALPSGVFSLRGSLSEARVKRVAAALTRNSLDAATRQARALLAVGHVFYRKLQMKLPPACRKPPEFQAFIC